MTRRAPHDDAGVAAERRPRLLAGGKADQIADLRVRAVLDVLAGQRPSEVAARQRVDLVLLHRWVSAFVDAGIAQVTNTPDPAQASQRDRFLGAFAHELRSPLTVAMGWVSILQDETLPGAVIHDSVVQLVEALERLTDRTLDVELLASASLGRLRVRPRDVAVAALTSGLVGLREIGGGGPDARLEVDPVLFSRVLRDLWNASALRPEPRARRMEVHSEADWHELSIIRDADPIDVDVLHALFEPFELNNDSTGITIGLYLARALTVAHGGTLGVDQDESHARFWVRVPRHVRARDPQHHDAPLVPNQETTR